MKYSPFIYALDIGNSSIKFIKFKCRWHAPEIVDARLYPLPLDFATVSNEQQKINGWKKALGDLLGSEKEEGKKRIIVSLPGESAIVRYITLPNIPPSKIHKIIRFEAEQQIPLLFRDVEWSYEVLPSRGKKEVDVVIAAAKKTLIESLTETIQSFNFSVESFEASQLVLYNIARFHDLDKSGSILIDMGAQSIHVLMFYHGISWGRTLRYGTFDITQAIAQELAIDLREAEKLKKVEAHTGAFQSSQQKPGEQASPQSVVRIMENVLYDIVSEVSRTISYYLSVVRGAVFEHIYLTGGGANIKNIDGFFEKNLGIRTECTNFISRVSVSSYLEDRVNFDKDCYATVVGLACSYRHSKALKANLLSEVIRHNRLQGAYRKRFYFFVVVTFLIVLTFAVNVTYERTLKQRIVSMLSSRLQQIEQQEKRLRLIGQDIEKSTAALTLLARKQAEREFIPAFLQEVQALLLDTVWFDSMAYNRDMHAFVISGRTTGTLADISTLQKSLRGLMYVDDVTFEAAHIEEETIDNKPLRIFTITVRFNSEEET